MKEFWSWRWVHELILILFSDPVKKANQFIIYEFLDTYWGEGVNSFILHDNYPYLFIS